MFPTISVPSDWDTFQWCSGPVIRTKKAVENKSPGLADDKPSVSAPFMCVSPQAIMYVVL